VTKTIIEAAGTTVECTHNTVYPDRRSTSLRIFCGAQGTPYRCSTKHNSLEMFDGTSFPAVWFYSATSTAHTAFTGLACLRRVEVPVAEPDGTATVRATISFPTELYETIENSSPWTPAVER
jgi:hypothetical protein